MVRGGFGVSIGLLLASTAHAQTAPPGGATPPLTNPDGTPRPRPIMRRSAALDGGAYLPAIVVTATKRQEKLQDVAISVQALDAKALVDFQVRGFDDYAKLLPSLSYLSYGPSQAQINFRGIRTGGDGLSLGGATLPTTGLYIDETPVTTAYVSVDMHVYDMARVEALSGPQGTLYGASSLSGTLRLITNKPDTKKFAAGFDVETNKFGKGGFGGTAEGFVNIPLSDRIALRAVGFYTRIGGYIDNKPTVGRTVYNPITKSYMTGRPYRRTESGYLADGVTPDPAFYSNAAHPDDYYTNNLAYAKDDFNTEENYGGRALLKIDLNDHWTVSPGIIYQNQTAHGAFLFDPRVGDLQVHDFTDDYNHDRWYLASATIQGKISDWDLTYAGSYFHRTIDNVSDYSYFSVAYDTYASYNYYKDAAGHDLNPDLLFHGHDTYEKQSHELRIASPVGKPLRLTAGAFMQRQRTHGIGDYYIPGLGTASVGFNTPIPGAPADDAYFKDQVTINRDYAVFAEASYDLTPKLTILGGVRGFRADNTLKGFAGGLPVLQRMISIVGCTGTTVQQCPNVDKRYTENGETHKATLTWRATPTKMVYFTYSTGFRPGGNNPDGFALGQQQIIPPFKADITTNFELGWKTEWLNNRLRIDGALFWEDWKKVQYSQAGLLGIFYTVNAGTARSRGGELEVTYVPIRALSLTATGTYADARLTSDFVDANGVNQAPKGTRLPANAKLRFNASARYSFDIGRTKAFVQTGVNHQSGTTTYLTTVGQAVLGGTKPYTTVDVSAGLSWGKFSLTAFLQNAFDERGVLSKNAFCAISAPVYCGYYARSYPIKPQFFGLRGSVRY